MGHGNCPCKASPGHGRSTTHQKQRGQWGPSASTFVGCSIRGSLGLHRSSRSPCAAHWRCAQSRASPTQTGDRGAGDGSTSLHGDKIRDGDGRKHQDCFRDHHDAEYFDRPDDSHQDEHQVRENSPAKTETNPTVAAVLTTPQSSQCPNHHRCHVHSDNHQPRACYSSHHHDGEPHPCPTYQSGQHPDFLRHVRPYDCSHRHQVVFDPNPRHRRHLHRWHCRGRHRRGLCHLLVPPSPNEGPERQPQR